MSNAAIEREAMNAGALYLAIRPFNVKSVAEIIRILIARGLEEENDQVRER